MLFDLRGRGRRRTVQGIYLLLAVLMGGGLVLFGIGGSVQGGLVDALKGGGSGGTSNTFDSRVKATEKQVAANPSNAAAWAQLAHLRFQLAGTGENYSQTQSTFTSKGQAELAQVKDAWQHYLALNPPHPDPDVANEMIQAFGGQGALNDFADASRAAQIVANVRPSAAIYAQVAAYSYLAGNARLGDLAATKAVGLAPAAQRAGLKQQLASAKAQAKSGSATSSQPAR